MLLECGHVATEHLCHFVGGLELFAGFQIMEEEPEFDRGHAVADEDLVFFSGIGFLHFFQAFLFLGIGEGNIGIAYTDSNTVILKHPVNQLSHFLV